MDRLRLTQDLRTANKATLSNKHITDPQRLCQPILSNTSSGSSHHNINSTSLLTNRGFHINNMVMDHSIPQHRLRHMALSTLVQYLLKALPNMLVSSRTIARRNNRKNSKYFRTRAHRPLISGHLFAAHKRNRL